MFAKDCYESTDEYPELAEACVTCVRNPHVWPRLSAHIQTYAGTKTGMQPDPIHRAVRKAMLLRVDRCGALKGDMTMKEDSEAPSYHTRMIGRMKRNILPRPQVSAATRWGTRGEGQFQLCDNGRALAAGVIQTTGDGTEVALKKAAVALFQTSGFQVDGSVRTTAKLGKHLRCLTSQRLNLYHAFGRFLCVFTVRPMLRAYSTHLECSAVSVCGVSSYFRRVLHFFTDELFVGMFNSADKDPKVPYLTAQAPGRSKQFTGTSQKFNNKTRKDRSKDPESTVRLAHRGWASLGGSHKILFLVNPRADVKKVFGEFATDEMIAGVRAMLSDFRRIAEMDGRLELLPTLEKRWMDRETARKVREAARKVREAGKNTAAVTSGASGDERRARTANAIAGAQYAHNMHKAQWAFREILKDVVRATIKWFDHELYSLFGVLACMIQTRWVHVVEVATGKKMQILIAHEDAIPNGQVGSRIFDELEAQFQAQGQAEFLEYYPPQLTDMLKDGAAMLQFTAFLRRDAMTGFHLLDKNGDVVLVDTRKKDENGENITEPVVPGPAPLWRFPDLVRRVLKLLFRQLTSNDVEEVFSLVALGFRGGGKNVGYRCISSWCRRRDWVRGRFFGMEVNPDFLKVYGAARRLLRENENGFRRVFTSDDESRERRKRWKQQKELPAYIKNGSGKFVTTNLGPSIQESFVGPKREASNDPTATLAMPANPITGLADGIRLQRIAARRTALKSKQPRARATSCKARLPGKGKQKGEPQPQHLGLKRRRRGYNYPGGQAEHDDAPVEADESSAEYSAAGPAFSPASQGTGSSGADAADTPALGPQQTQEAKPGKRKLRSSDASDSTPMQTFVHPAPGCSGSGSSSDVGAAAGPAAGGAVAHAAGSHPLVLIMQERLDALHEDKTKTGWIPAVRVDVKRSSSVNEILSFGMRSFEGKENIVRKNSSCTLNLVYGDADGAVKLIQICATQKEATSHYMEYYFVYPNAKAIVEADRKEDVAITTTDADGIVKRSSQIGSNSLRTAAMHWQGIALHHAGDILHKSTDSDGLNLGNIVGTIAWVPVMNLPPGKRALDSAGNKSLLAALKALGISNDEAGRLKENPIVLGSPFNERKPSPEECDDDEDAMRDEGLHGNDGFVKQATVEEARAQRAAARAAAKQLVSNSASAEKP